MKIKILAWVLGVLFTIPCVVRAEEIEIQLMEVTTEEVSPIMGPRDGVGGMGNTPPCPSCFRATINVNNLSITKLEESIPSAQATVVNAQTGSIVLNQQFTNSLSQQISNAGMYVLHIQTAGGALVGQFVVQ